MIDPRRLTESKDAIPVVLYTKRDETKEDAWPISFGINIPPYDFVSRTLSGTTTEIWGFRTGGTTGTLVATVTIVYTDSTLETISTVARA